MRGPFLCQYGMTGGCTGAGTIGTSGGFGGTTLATGTGPVGAGAGGVGDSDRATGFTRGFRRFGIFWRSSHTRSVSSDTSTSSLASDSAISRIDAPAPRSVSSTSRYGSNSANRRDLGRRPSAIKRASAPALSVPAMGAFLPPTGGASVIFRAGMGAPGCSFRGNTGGRTSGPTEWTGGRAVAAGMSTGRRVGPTAGRSVRGVGSGVGIPCCMGATYSSSTCDATGALRATSKRKRLDVGVLTYFFLLFWFSQLDSIFGFLVSGFTGLVDLVVLGIGSLVGLDYWIHRFLKFQGKFFLGFFDLHLVAGGGGC